MVAVIVIRAASSVTYAGGGEPPKGPASGTPEFRDQVKSQVNRELVSLTPFERALVLDTHFRVKMWPNAQDLYGQVPGGLLLGLYTSPPPTITVFQGPTVQAGKTAAEVVHHEIGHRLGYDHSIADIRRLCGVGGGSC